MDQNIILQASNIKLTPNGENFSTFIRRGEILGLAGLEGQGQQLFLRSLCGLNTSFEGTVQITAKNAEPVHITDLHKAAEMGVYYLPRERKTEGIFPALSVEDNFFIGMLSLKTRFGIVNKNPLREELEKYRKRLSMVFSSPSAQITSLSGGNQQKVLLARWMAVHPVVMLLDDPTRGVDIQTKNTLYSVFKEMAEEEGVTLVLLSTEIEEFLQLCDRTMVFYNKSMFTEMTKAEQTRKRIMDAMFGREHE